MRKETKIENTKGRRTMGFSIVRSMDVRREVINGMNEAGILTINNEKPSHTSSPPRGTHQRIEISPDPSIDNSSF